MIMSTPSMVAAWVTGDCPSCSLSITASGNFMCLVSRLDGTLFQRPYLLLEHLLHVADFTLHLTSCFFDRAAVAQVWIPCHLARLFFHFALRFLVSTLDLILCA